MKTAKDPRHQRRIDLMQKIFSVSFHSTMTAPELSEVMDNLELIDDLIQNAAPEWPVDKISKIDLAILRLAVYELAVVRSEPPKVVIDEAVELAKEYGNQSSSSFVNGVLGTIVKRLSYDI